MTYFDDIVVFGVGIGAQLAKHVTEEIDNHPLWCTRFLHSDKEAILKTYQDLLQCKTDIILTNTYQATVENFMKYLNLSRAESEDLIRESVRLAKTAINKHCKECSSNKRPLLAGTVGPYAASLHDGSEYSGKYPSDLTEKFFMEWHKPLMKQLLDEGVDILLFGTIPCKMEAMALVKLMKNDFPGARALLAFSVKDEESLASGENFQAVAKYCYDLAPDQIIAVGLNCCPPKIAEGLMKGFNDDRKDKPIPLLVFPNTGEDYDPVNGWTGRDKCVPFESYVKTWLNLGAKVVGGCCRTLAENTIKIREEVEKWKKENSNN